MDDTTFEREAGFTTATTARRLDHLAEAVWRMIAEPARLAEWLAPGRIEQRVGGAVRLDFPDSGTVIDSAVSAFEDGRLVEFSWSKPGEPLRPVRIALVARRRGDDAGAGSVKTPEGEDPAWPARRPAGRRTRHAGSGAGRRGDRLPRSRPSGPRGKPTRARSRRWARARVPVRVNAESRSTSLNLRFSFRPGDSASKPSTALAPRRSLSLTQGSRFQTVRRWSGA